MKQETALESVFDWQVRTFQTREAQRGWTFAVYFDRLFLATFIVAATLALVLFAVRERSPAMVLNRVSLAALLGWLGCLLARIVAERRALAFVAGQPFPVRGLGPFLQCQERGFASEPVEMCVAIHFAEESPPTDTLREAVNAAGAHGAVGVSARGEHVQVTVPGEPAVFKLRRVRRSVQALCDALVTIHARHPIASVCVGRCDPVEDQPCRYASPVGIGQGLREPSPAQKWMARMGPVLMGFTYLLCGSAASVALYLMPPRRVADADPDYTRLPDRLEGSVRGSGGRVGTWELRPARCLHGLERGFQGVLLQFADHAPVRELRLDDERPGDNVIELHFADDARQPVRLRERDCASITGGVEVSLIEINGRLIRHLHGDLDWSCPAVGLEGHVSFNGCMPERL